jgi:hypothetical protein
MNETNNKIDIIMIIVLALLVAFIIGFNIIQIIDKKLNSVIINVPPQSCNIPSILVNFDKDNKPIKLNNEQINYLTNIKPDIEQNRLNFENFENEEKTINSNQSMNSDTELDQTIKTNNDYSENFGNIELKENYGSLPDKYETRDDENKDRFSQRTSRNLGNEIINKSNGINPQDPNYNVIDNYPFLIDPDDDKKGYYNTRIKLITDNSSPLMKLEKMNMQKINEMLESCSEKEKPLKVNETYDGYNKYPNLQGGSFANFTSIGKSLLTPYVSYPVPS